MRVLILHNRYRSEGGEERAVRETAALLRRHGHTVEVLERSSADAGRGRAARALLAGGEDPGSVAQAVRDLRADVVHAHNLHPLLGWRALAAARAAGARTVLHVHNFRLVCAVGVAYRDGAPCHRCHAVNTVPGLVHRCRGGVAEAAVYAAGLARQQRRLLGAADALVVLSQAHQAALSRFGLAVGDAHVLPNFAASSVEATAADSGGYALVAGRLVEEKGFDTAILAAKAAGVPLVIAGQGPDEARLRRLARGGDVRFAGWLAEEELNRVRAGAAVALAPSRWEEVSPYTVIDALAAGLPTLVSDRGGLPEMVQAGSVLPAGDAGAWTSRLAAVFADPSGRRSSGEAALQRARERFGAAAYLSRLLEIYSG